MEIELNQLEILGVRKLNYMPPHYTKMRIEPFAMHYIEEWIQSKLSGRYCITAIPSITKNDSLKSEVYVGFEEEKEMTYFMLACPDIRRN